MRARLYAIILKKASDTGLIDLRLEVKLAAIVNSYDKAWENFPPYADLYQALKGLELSEKKAAAPIAPVKSAAVIAAAPMSSTQIAITGLAVNSAASHTATQSTDAKESNNSNLALAKQANEYVRAHIKFGMTQIENNKYDLPTYSDIMKTTKAMRDLLKDPDGYPENGNFLKVDPDYDLYEFDWRVQIYMDKQRGSCREMAELALTYVANNGSTDAVAEIYELAAGDHTFLVIGRKPGSTLEDPTTWGPDAYVCDPLLNSVFNAAEYTEKLMNCRQNPPDNNGRCFNFTEVYNKSEHGKIVPLHGINTQFLRQRNAHEYLDQMEILFKQRIEGLLKILNEYKDALKQPNIDSKLREAKINLIDEKINKLKEYLASDRKHIKDGGDYNGIKKHYQNVLQRCIGDARAIAKDMGQLAPAVTDKLNELFKYGENRARSHHAAPSFK